MKTPLNAWALEIHEQAKSKGWWDEPRTLDEVASLIHSEWSEALEEYRAGRPLVWAEDGAAIYSTVDMVRRSGQKPEGIAVELVDGCIRILDYMATVWPTDREELWFISKNIDADSAHMPLPSLVAVLHSYIVHAYDLDPDRLERGHLLGCITFVSGWLRAKGLDFEDVMRLKHDYNKNRPYRHGGKKL